VIAHPAEREGGDITYWRRTFALDDGLAQASADSTPIMTRLVAQMRTR
jgi:hypothetical protein